MHETKSPVSYQGKPRSLRMRLLLWYVTLLTVALSLFVTLILVLTMNAIEQNAESDVRAEVHEEIVRLSRLVQDLLLLARADGYAEIPLVVKEKTVSLSTESTHQPSIELDRVVLELIRKLRSSMSIEGSKLKLEIGHVEPVSVKGDEEHLRRVMLILLDNAIKYTPTGNEVASGCVTVSLKQMDKKAMLRVRDTGIGIDPADLPHIFERFYRANRARPRQGTGLGLSIAQTLVEQLDGYITTESIPGKGSTFTVWLPLE